MTQPDPAPTERVRLSHVTENFATLHERPTFTQMFGARILNILMGVICSLVIAFLLAWLFTRPTLVQVKETLGSTAEPKVVLETFRELQRDHFDYFRGLFQLLVLSGLIPLITLFAGYTFGAQTSERRPSSSAGGETS